MSRPSQKSLLLEILIAAGTHGMGKHDLIESLTARGVQLKPKSWDMMLVRARQEGVIFGRGVFMPMEHGKKFRYFAREDWCAEYVFEGALTPEGRAERERLLSLERNRRRRLSQPEKPPRRRLADMTLEERRANDAKRCREYRARQREKLIAQGITVRVRPLVGTSERTIRRKARTESQPVEKRAARPGSELVAHLESVDAPVRVTKRPVLIGDPIITASTRVTVAPVRADYRFYVDPAEVRPVFGALPVGRYLEEAEAV